MMEELNGELFSDPLSGLGDEGGSLESSDIDGHQQQNCNICEDKLCSPRVLSCLHVFCEDCIAKLMVNEAGDSLKYDIGVECPTCKQETKVPGGEPASLPSDYVLTNILDVSAVDQSVVCTCCKSKEPAVARCSDCSHFLCLNCNSAHEFMRCFENHRVVPFDALRTSKDKSAIHKPIFCSLHLGESLKYYCCDCKAPACGECLSREHKAGEHRCERIADAEAGLRAQLRSAAADARDQASRAGAAAERLDDALSELQRQREDAQGLIEEAYQSYKAALHNCRDRAQQTLERLHKERELKVMDLFESVDKTVRKIDHACKFTTRLLQHGDGTEIVMLKSTVSSQFERLLAAAPELDVNYSISFVTDFDKFEDVANETFGSFHTESSAADVRAAAEAAASRGSLAHTPAPTLSPGGFEDFTLPPPPVGGVPVLPSIVEYNLQQLASIAEKEVSGPSAPPASPFTLADLLVSDLNSPHAYNNLQALAKLRLSAEVNGAGVAAGAGVGRSTPALLSPAEEAALVASAGGVGSGVGGVGSVGGAGSPVVRAGKAAPMHIRFKFGQLGGSKGQFNSPHGFCLGNDEDIIVADTNNHRITVFEKTGTYKFHFGVAGKEEGQLWYPRKVAVVRATGKFVVCDRGNERSRMQIFTKNGHFLKKIAVRYIDIVAGLAVTAQGHIVAVDSVTPTVFVISENGDLLSWFDCSDCMREPSDIAISGKEFYVCDFKGHCVVVFTEDGKFVRRIGCENVTNFPNGIDVSDAGDVLIGDSHGNKFHVAVFSRDGVLVTEFECPYVKVSRCCGLKITSEGYIVTLAKNNHHVLVLNTLYIV